MKLQHYLDQAIKNIYTLEGDEYETASWAIRSLFEDLSNEIESLEYSLSDANEEISNLKDELADTKDELDIAKSNIRDMEHGR
jgi:peptidoglycan hydrolase CwlO-like protein